MFQGRRLLVLARCLRFIAVSAPLWAASSSIALALEEAYATSAPIYLNHAHQNAAEVWRLSPGPEKETRRQAAIEELLRQERDALKKFGPASVEAAVVRIDLGRLLGQDAESRKQAALLIQAAIPALRASKEDQRHAGKLIEALFVLAEMTFPLETYKLDAEAYRKAMSFLSEAAELSKRPGGSNPRTGALFRLGLKFAETSLFSKEAMETGNVERLARDYLKYAVAIGSDEDQLDATVALAAVLTETNDPDEEALRWAQSAQATLAGKVRSALIGDPDADFERQLHIVAGVFKRHGRLDDYVNTSKLSFRLYDAHGYPTTFEAFAWIYDYALILKDLGLLQDYRETLGHFGRKLRSIEAKGSEDQTVSDHLLALLVGAGGRMGEGQFQEARALLTEALAEMDPSSAVTPALHVKTLLDLADLEQRHGVGVAAKPLATKAFEMLGGERAEPSQEALRALGLLRNTAIGERDIPVIEGTTRKLWSLGSKLRAQAPDESGQMVPFVDELTASLVSTDVCDACSEPFLRDAKRNVWETLALARNAELMQSRGDLPRTTAWRVMTSELDLPPELSEAALAYAQTLHDLEIPSVSGKTLFNLVGLDKVEPTKRLRAYLFCQVFTTACIGSGEYVLRHFSVLLTNSDPAAKRVELKAILQRKLEESFDYGETGNIAALVRDLFEGVRFGDSVGDQTISDYFLAEILERLDDHAPDAKQRGEHEVELAEFTLPALARLANGAARTGNPHVARQLIDRANAIVVTKTEREWRVGSAAAAASLRNLRSSLESLAGTEIQLAGKGEQIDGVARAFVAIQRAQLSETGLTFLESLRRQAELQPGVSELISQRNETELQLRWLDDRRAALHSKAEPTIYIDRGRRLKDELANSSQKIEDKIKGAELLFGARPLPLDDARALLKPDEAILLTFVQDDQASVVFVSQRTAEIWTTPTGRSEVEDLVRKIREGAASVNSIFDATSAYTLFERLLGSVRKHRGQIKTLLEVPHGPLQSLPLSILLTEQPTAQVVSGQNYETFSWLARDFAVAVLPNVAVLEGQRKAEVRLPAPNPFAGVGNPRFGSTTVAARGPDFRSVFSGSALANGSLLRQLSALPETEDEIRTIAQTLGAKEEDLLLGALASETVIKQRDLKSYRILAFATHGLVAGDAAPGAEPGLALTIPETPTRLDDGLLTPSEISLLQLNSDLVILSACDTAASDGRPQAEGLSGLVRGFFSAGARGLLVSHWKVPSMPTVALTTGMVRIHESGGNVSWAEAHRRSLVELMSEKGRAAHPANWGAFVFVGAP